MVHLKVGRMIVSITRPVAAFEKQSTKQADRLTDFSIPLGPLSDSSRQPAFAVTLLQPLSKLSSKPVGRREKTSLQRRGAFAAVLCSSLHLALTRRPPSANLCRSNHYHLRASSPVCFSWCPQLPPVLATPSSAGTASDGLVARSKIRDLQPQRIQLPLTVDINMHTRGSLRAWPDVLELEWHAEGIEAIGIFQNHSR